MVMPDTQKATEPKTKHLSKVSNRNETSVDNFHDEMWKNWKLSESRPGSSQKYINTWKNRKRDTKEKRLGRNH